jgi:predicted ArsR family transcriptional regulator
VALSTDHHGCVGRPQHRWSVVPQAPSLGLEPAGFRLLAHLLAEVAAEAPCDAGQVAAVGRRRVGERAAGQTSGQPSRPPGPRRTPRSACVAAVMEELADLGFDPALDSEASESRTTISFTHCPFREVAMLYPDVVCQLHRGITEGILAGAVAATPGVTARVETFASLVDLDPCRVEMSVYA